MTTTENTILVRRDTSANWASANPVPKAGEWCYETDTGITKIGDGTTLYTSLTPIGKTTASATELNILDGATVSTSELNVLDGITANTMELNYVDGVTANIQTQLDAKFAGANVQTAFGDTPSDEKVASEKLVKDTFDTKQDVIAVNNAFLKQGVFAPVSVIGDKNAGRTYYEPKTYLKMYNAAHSTFDATKFTKVGSPTVTDNGIAYGFSDNDKLTLTVPKFGNQLRFKCAFTTGSDVTTTNQYLFDSNNFRFYFVYVGDAYFLPDVYINDGNANFYLRDTSETFTLQANTKYFAEVGYNSNTQLLYIKIFTEDGTMVEDTEATLTAGINLSGITGVTAAIGNRSTFGSFAGKTDLKYLELYADNELVFDGNVTGVDKIKDDNYTTVGSPVVTNGIVTSLSSANYLQYTSLPALKNTNFWEIVSPTFTPTTNNITNSGVFKLLTGASTNGFTVSFSDNGNITCLLQAPNFVDITRVTVAYGAGNKYQFRWVHNAYGDYKCYYRVNEGEWVLGNSVTSNTSEFDTATFYMQFGVNGANLVMNINTMYVVLNDNIVYQPCMYIPYTLSNIGKIVDMSARGDVEHYFKQYGAAPYYVIDELNNLFILPHGSADSKIAPKILVDSYYNGASAWEQYLDGTMIQRGSMTADTPVTFPCEDEFADTNYTLSCPYSAKTKTGFTPTASGEYIAIGKV